MCPVEGREVAVFSGSVLFQLYTDCSCSRLFMSEGFVCVFSCWAGDARGSLPGLARGGDHRDTPERERLGHNTHNPAA